MMAAQVLAAARELPEKLASAWVRHLMAAQVLALVALALVEVAVSVALVLELTHSPYEAEVEGEVEGERIFLKRRG